MIKHRFINNWIVEHTIVLTLQERKKAAKKAAAKSANGGIAVDAEDSSASDTRRKGKEKERPSNSDTPTDDQVCGLFRVIGTYS